MAHRGTKPQPDDRRLRDTLLLAEAGVEFAESCIEVLSRLLAAATDQGVLLDAQLRADCDTALALAPQFDSVRATVQAAREHYQVR